MKISKIGPDFGEALTNTGESRADGLFLFRYNALEGPSSHLHKVFSCVVGNFQHVGFPSWLINIIASTHYFVGKLNSKGNR